MQVAEVSTRRVRPTRLKSLGPSPALHVSLARRRLERGELALARAEAEAALRQDPSQFAAHLVLSEVHTRVGDERAALLELERCLQLSPRFADAIVRVGDLHARFGRLDEAISSYLRAVRVDPGQVPPRVKLAATYFAKGEYREANDAFREAVRLDPGLATGRHTIGDYYTLMSTFSRFETCAPLSAEPGADARPEPEGPWPAIRPDLEVVLPLEGDPDPKVLIKDPAQQTFFEASEVEGFLCTHLDGRTSVTDLREGVEARYGVIVSDDDVVGFIRQLDHFGLLAGPRPAVSPETTAVVFQGREAVMPALPGASRPNGLTRYTTLPVRAFLRAVVVAPWDVLSLHGRAERAPVRKYVWFNPDRMVAALARHLSWVFTRGFVVASALVAAVAAYVLLTRFSGFWTESLLIWRSSGLPMLAFAGILFVHVPHQFAHAVACAYRGGHVRACGIRMMLHVMPTFYCDLSDTPYLREKSYRLWTIGAGLYYQGLAFSVGLIFWALTPWGTFAHSFWLALTSAAMWGLIFNGNPGIKRDMYQLLSGWLEVPNMREAAFDSLRAWVRWLWAPEPLTSRERNWLRAYALLSAAYGLVHTAWASSFFFYRSTVSLGGDGAILSLVVAGVLLQDHVKAYAEGPRGWLQRLGGARVSPTVLWIGLLVLVVIVGLLPYPYHAGGPFVLLPSRRLDVRSELEGLVERIYVREGEWVEEGQPIAALAKRTYERNLSSAEAQIAEKRARLDLLRAGARPEQIDVARQNVETARVRLEWSRQRAQRYEKLFKDGLISVQEVENAQHQRDVDEQDLALAESNLKLTISGARDQEIEALEAEIESLEALAGNYRVDVERTVITSPMSGRVITPRVEELVGAYIKPGQRDVIMQIEDPRTVRAEVEIPEEEGASVQVGARVQIAPWAFPDRSFDGMVVKIAPVATTSSTDRPDDVFSSESSGGGQVSLSGTRFKVVRVISEIPNPDGVLKSEMTGYAKVSAGYRPVWDVLLRPLIRWIKVEVWYWIP